MIEITRGETLAAQLTLRQAAGGPVIDLTDATVTCQLRNREALVADLTVEIADPATGGIVAISAASTVTDDWPVSDNRNRLLADVKIVIDGAVTYSPAFEILVKDNQTE